MCVFKKNKNTYTNKYHAFCVLGGLLIVNNLLALNGVNNGEFVRGDELFVVERIGVPRELNINI